MTTLAPAMPVIRKCATTGYTADLGGQFPTWFGYWVPLVEEFLARGLPAPRESDVITPTGTAVGTW